MIRWLRHRWAHFRFHREMADLDRKEREARKRNCTRDVGAVRREKYRRVHDALSATK